MVRKMMLVTAVLVLIGLIGGVPIYAQGPQPHAPLVPSSVFTYQGQLKSGGTPYTGSCDFQFGLWNASTVGAQIGGTQSVAGVPVANGLFTTPLDFGLTAFDGSPRFLQIGVRCPAGAGSYTPLSSRQPLTAAPMALYANTAGSVINLPSGSASYIQNTTSQQSGANFNISGSGTLGGALNLLETTASGAGMIKLGGYRFLHNYGSNNAFLGLNAGNLTMTGGQNTAMGKDALTRNTNGGFNTAVGHEAMYNNTSGANNTAIGALTLRNSITGILNTAVGSGALAEGTTGSSNTAIGASALQSNAADDNTAVGYAALWVNYQGAGNTAVGVSALQDNNASAGTAVGIGALRHNTSGSQNTALGVNSLFYNTLGEENTAIGVSALQTNITGTYNTAVGVNALRNNNAGNNTAVGTYALNQITSGFLNIAIGKLAGGSYTGGEHENIVIGNPGSVGESNTIRIGTPGTHTKAYIAGISDTAMSNGSAVVVNMFGQLGTVVSSQRFKDNIRAMGKTSDILYQLRPVGFNYKPKYGGSPDQPQVGLIAEEVAAVAPWMVVNDEKGQPYTVRYEMLAPMLVNELQKQQGTIQTQASEIADLRSQVASLQQENAATASRLDALETTVARGGPAAARNGLDGLGTPVWALVGMLGLLVGQRAWKGVRP